MFTRRELLIVLITAGLTLGGVGLVSSMERVLETEIFRWSELEVEETASGQLRSYFRAPTSTLLKLGLRARTLEPEASAHPERPNAQTAEQLLVVKEGTLEVTIDGETSRLGAGSAVFLGPNQQHALRNAGERPVTYYTIEWRAPGMNGEPQEIGL